MKQAAKTIFKGLFILSLGYYIIWLVYAISCYFTGIDSGWLIPSLSNHEMLYGFEAFVEGLKVGYIFILLGFWFVPLYQLVYLGSVIISKIMKE